MAKSNTSGSEVSLDAPEKRILHLEKTSRDLYQRLEQLSSLLNHLPGMAFRCLYDRELTFEYASEGSREILGYDPDEITSGYAFRQMVHRGDQPQNKKVIASLAPENNRYHMEYRMRAAWGEDRWIHEQGTAIFSEEGDLVAIEGLLTDITEHKQRELKLHEENQRLKSSISDRFRLGELIGKSEAMQKVYQRIMKAAETDASVIVGGESGTGKELAARAIHDLSERRDKPFVAVNCGAIPETLLESEFFGHVRGSFSGAYTDRDGYLKAADGGTLFLDEVGEMPLGFQVKLLRALDGRGFAPVGENKIRTSNFRLISASNRDLAEMVRTGGMREDFYYRIDTVPILMPPLRERKEDLPLLLDHFTRKFSEDTGSDAPLPPEVLVTLEQHHWPGNVRELQNVIRRYLTLKEISFPRPMGIRLPMVTPPRPEAMPAPVAAPASQARQAPAGPVSAERVSEELGNVEKAMIVKALGDNRWHIGRTAAALGISRRTLQRRLNKYGLREP